MVGHTLILPYTDEVSYKGLLFSLAIIHSAHIMGLGRKLPAPSIILVIDNQTIEGYEYHKVKIWLNLRTSEYLLLIIR